MFTYRIGSSMLARLHEAFGRMLWAWTDWTPPVDGPPLEEFDFTWIPGHEYRDDGLPPAAGAYIADWHGFEVLVVFELTNDDTIEVVSVGAEARSEAGPGSAAEFSRVLERLPLERWTRKIVDTFAGAAGVPTERDGRTVLDDRNTPKALDHARAVLDPVVQAARIYNDAPSKPTKTVATQLGVNYSKARRLTAEARDRDLIAPAPGQGKASPPPKDA